MHSKVELTPKTWNMLHSGNPSEEDFIQSLPVSRTLGRILFSRGIDTLRKLQQFLNPCMDDLYDPSLMDGVDWAVARTKQAIAAREKIMIHGDYDVDGITSTALLVRVLRLLKADVSWYIPHRQREGYDIGRPAVDTAKERGVSLIITVDCGTTAVDPVEYARSLGIDVIVTDHHEVGTKVSPANVIINPKKPGCPYPFKNLAGVGVAYKFAEALIRDCGYDVSSFRTRFCDLFAIGTVADIVTLIDENRTLVQFGLQELPRTGKKGLRALMDVAGITGKPITSQSLAFGLAPRLNAAGRLDDAGLALELLLTRDESEAVQLGQSLESQNKARQAEQERITREAMDQVSRRHLDVTSKILVLSSQGWHPGVIGIVASKVTDRYSRPSILIAVDETGTTGVGSARSTAAFDIFGALVQCDHLLERYGGHAHAAGLSINADNLSEFDATINGIADAVMTADDLLPQIDVDAELDLDCVTLDLAKELQLLEPYGHGNSQPVFMSRNALILHKTKLGTAGAHLKLRLDTGSGQPLECIAFGWGDKEEAFKLGRLIDVCYNVQVNSFAGRESVQIVLRDARISDAVIAEPFACTHSA